MTVFVRKILVFAAVSLLLLTQACGPVTPVAYPNPYPNSHPNTGAVSVPTVANPTPSTADAVTRVSLTDAKAAFDAKTAVFLDVRDAQSYALAHVPGALNIPLNELEARLGELNPNAWIITYCT